MNRSSFLKNASLDGLTAASIGTDFVPTEDGRDDAGQVDTIVALRQTDPAESAWVFVEGYHEPFDGGGLFGWEPGASEPVDEGLVVASVLGGTATGQNQGGTVVSPLQRARLRRAVVGDARNGAPDDTTAL